MRLTSTWYKFMKMEQTDFIPHLKEIHKSMLSFTLLQSWWWMYLPATGVISWALQQLRVLKVNALSGDNNAVITLSLHLTSRSEPIYTPDSGQMYPWNFLSINPNGGQIMHLHLASAIDRDHSVFLDLELVIMCNEKSIKAQLAAMSYRDFPSNSHLKFACRS